MPLTGSDLLAKVKELGNASKSDLVRAAGYLSTKQDGSERLNFTAFYEALLEAKGVRLGDGGVKAGTGGRNLSYVATVQGNGNLLVSKAYTALLDLKPGDRMKISLKNDQIRLSVLDPEVAEYPKWSLEIFNTDPKMQSSRIWGLSSEVLSAVNSDATAGAIKTVVDYAQKAVVSGMIDNPRDAALCVSALLLAGAQQAQYEGTQIVNSSQVNSGWERFLRYCPGNLPPDECMLRSIVDRESELRKNLAGFKFAADLVSKKVDTWRLE